MAYPSPIQDLIEEFKNLPGVGKKTAERYVFYILKSGKKEAADLAKSVNKLLKEVTSCKNCWNFSDKSPCNICSDPKRNKKVISVVAEPQDLEAMEKVKEYNGLYHILRGTIEADREDNLKYLKVKELLKRIKQKDIKEVILSLNPSMEGETTMMYLEKQIDKLDSDVKVSRLARGLPMGSSLQYADEITLGSALKNRTQNK